ncbi:hypothetical protein F5Y17DRAFT_460545 [Xylariaceae sp. FL0594]|nr:hypothetical protein F5Y17DRAFT_460545 [Xylariaceae sp. FL0594]
MDALSIVAMNASTVGNGNRVSVACLSCRTRHVRCDAQQPACMRCTSEGRTCQYVKSRRGGLDRARLAARRRGHIDTNQVAVTVPGSPPNGSISGRAELDTDLQDRVPEEHANSTGWPAEPETSGASGTSSDERGASSMSGPTDGIQFSSVETDFLVKLFYRNFHRCHPCALPQRHLHRLYEETTQNGPSRGLETLTLLIAIMRFIGSMYSYKDLTSQLQDQVVGGFHSIRAQPITASSSPSTDPFLVQCHLLFSIALYWNAEKTRAREEIDAAIRIALELGMHRARFASLHARSDPVLGESFRRTWWQLYCTDAYYAAIKRNPTFPLCDVDTDADLPCEEDEYESGSIPPPKTLEDFDTREFSPENQAFSSFAYLIGATRSIALALSAGSSDACNWLSPRTIAEVDAIIDGWYLLLPREKREVLREGNVVDELMFQAHMAVHANLIAIHRPLSSLPFHPLEGLSSCLVEPPTPPHRPPLKHDPSSSSSSSSSVTAHTHRCLQSVEAQLRLLVLSSPLPLPPRLRSPFTICMTAAGTNALLAAIASSNTHQKPSRQIAVARHQLRLVVAYIRDLARVWPQGRHNLREVQTIAREVLAAPTTKKRQGALIMTPPKSGGVATAKRRVSNWEGTVARAPHPHPHPQARNQNQIQNQLSPQLNPPIASTSTNTSTVFPSRIANPGGLHESWGSDGIISSLDNDGREEEEEGGQQPLFPEPFFWGTMSNGNGNGNGFQFTPDIPVWFGNSS